MNETLLTVRLFASARDLADGHASVDLSLHCENPLVRDLLEGLERAHPGLGRPGRFLVSVNRRFAPPETPVRNGDEIALFPPVSGG